MTKIVMIHNNKENNIWLKRGHYLLKIQQPLLEYLAIDNGLIIKTICYCLIICIMTIFVIVYHFKMYFRNQLIDFNLAIPSS